MPTKIKRAIALSVAACGLALAGCWHKETQQQKFMDAMNHGNGAQANQIWLHMDPESRADFSHSQGMQPNVSPDEVKKQVMQHYQNEMGGGENGDHNGESVENPAPSVHLGGLESLPEWVGPTGAPPQSVTVPTQNEPSN
jgi:hypothetical protein